MHLANWLTTLRVTQGSRVAESFTVLPWERRFVDRTFRDGVDTAALSIGWGGRSLVFVVSTGGLLKERGGLRLGERRCQKT